MEEEVEGCDFDFEGGGSEFGGADLEKDLEEFAEEVGIVGDPRSLPFPALGSVAWKVELQRGRTQKRGGVELVCAYSELNVTGQES